MKSSRDLRRPLQRMSCRFELVSRRDGEVLDERRPHGVAKIDHANNLVVP